MTSILNKIIAAIREAWATEPVRVLTVVATVITFLAAKLGIVVDERSILEALEFVIPVLGLGFFARKQVTPAKK